MLTDVLQRHYQLRHYISSPEPGLIYYATDKNVHCFNVVSKQLLHIAVLPFHTMCTASGYGWVCVGGENGQFAAIEVGRPGASPGANLDSMLPLSLGDGIERPTLAFAPLTQQLHLKRIGGEIINSISIHSFPREGEVAEDEVVAVITNNDKTVRIYSLSQGLEITVLNLPWPVNHATISPDGQMLVAVGDYQQAFFFEKLKMSSASRSGRLTENRVQSTSHEWSNVSILKLHVPPSVMETGYFTTAWSSSSCLCAVGSECGYITVLDTELLKSCDDGEDAIVRIIRSSWPDRHTGPGAVRDVCFAPQPWDLLIWSEECGRVSVADLRTWPLVKQTINLDPKEEDLEKIDVISIDGDIDPDIPVRHAVIRGGFSGWDPDGEVGTAGLATSQDGPKFYVGTEKGIFEFSFNVDERKKSLAAKVSLKGGVAQPQKR